MNELRPYYPDGLPQRSALDSATARHVLQTVVGIPETVYTEGVDISQVGQFRVEQVGEAIQLVSRELMDEEGTVVAKPGVSPVTGQSLHFVRKNAAQDFPEGSLRLITYHSSISGEYVADPTDIRLTLLSPDGEKRRVESALPLADQTPIMRGSFPPFTDFRDPSFILDDPDPRSMELYRKSWRGARWTSANLLNWGTLIMPEHIDGRTPIEGS